MDYFFKVMERMLAVVAGIALCIMMVLTFVDVIGRYGFNKSIFGTSEVIELLMVIVIFAGMAFVTTSDQHIKVDIFDAWIKRRAPGLQRRAVQFFSITMYAFIAFVLTHHAIGSFNSGKRTAVLDGPQWLMPGAAALFSIIGVVLFLITIVSVRSHKPASGSTDNTAAQNDNTSRSPEL